MNAALRARAARRRGSRRRVAYLFAAAGGLAYFGLVARLRPRNPSAAPPFELPPPEPWDPSRLPPLGEAAAEAAVRRPPPVVPARGGGLLAELRAGAEGWLPASKVSAGETTVVEEGETTVFVAGLPLSGSDAVADLVAASRGAGNASVARNWAEAAAAPHGVVRVRVKTKASRPLLVSRRFDNISLKTKASRPLLVPRRFDNISLKTKASRPLLVSRHFDNIS